MKFNCSVLYFVNVYSGYKNIQPANRNCEMEGPDEHSCMFLWTPVKDRKNMPSNQNLIAVIV